MSEEKTFEVIKVPAARVYDAFAGKDGEIYYNILVSPNTTLIRAAKQVTPVKDEPGMMKFSLPSDFEVHLKQSHKNETTGAWEEIDCPVSVEDLKELIAEKEDLVGFTNFVVPAQNVSEVHQSNDGNSFQFVFMPGLGSTIRSAESIKPVNGRDEFKRFSVPASSKMKFRKKDKENPEKIEDYELSPVEVKVRIARMELKRMREEKQDVAPPKPKTR